MTTAIEQNPAQSAGKDVKQVLAQLSEKFPLCFNLTGEAKPLKIGIFQDLTERLTDEDGISKTQIRHALRMYTSSWRYLASVKLGVARVDLDGQAGELIDEQQAQHAAQTLEQSKAKAAESRKARQAEERAKQREQQKEQRKTAGGDKAGYKKAAAKPKAKGAQSERPEHKAKAVESKPEIELLAVDFASLQVGAAVQLKVGQRPVPATVVEISKNDVVVQLNSGMVIKTTSDKLFRM